MVLFMMKKEDQSILARVDTFLVIVRPVSSARMSIHMALAMECT